MMDSKTRQEVDEAERAEAAAAEPRLLYRYRTSAFHGNWFATEEEAAEDALRAGQAYRDGRGKLALRGDCRIETGTGEEEG